MNLTIGTARKRHKGHLKKMESFYLFPDGELKLSKEQAEYIRELRLGPVRRSYRMIARLFTRKYQTFLRDNEMENLKDKDYILKHFKGALTVEEMLSFTDHETGNQLLGIDLCTAAMRYFYETSEDGWN